MVTLAANWLFYGKLKVSQLSAGAATVTLNDSSASYFDQYLDEIVYNFEISDRNVVIFEDIDRFNDSHIFEALRALNTESVPPANSCWVGLNPRPLQRVG